MTARRFHLGDVLSVTTGRLLSPQGLDGPWALLDFMTGDCLFNHQIPRAGAECGPSLLAQHPDLASVVVPEFPAEGAKAAVAGWLDEQVVRFGEFLNVAPLAAGEHKHVDPLTELAAMMRPEPTQ